MHITPRVTTLLYCARLEGLLPRGPAHLHCIQTAIARLWCTASLKAAKQEAVPLPICPVRSELPSSSRVSWRMTRARTICRDGGAMREARVDGMVDIALPGSFSHGSRDRWSRAEYLAPRSTVAASGSAVARKNRGMAFEIAHAGRFDWGVILQVRQQAFHWRLVFSTPYYAY